MTGILLRARSLRDGLVIALLLVSVWQGVADAAEPAAKENYRGDVSVLRLLPRPIDRYEDREAGIDDGAMFAFTYGTNPEIVLLLECHGEEWQFALARMAWAELKIERAGELLHVFSEMDSAAPNDAYTAQIADVLLP